MKWEWSFVVLYFQNRRCCICKKKNLFRWVRFLNLGSPYDFADRRVVLCKSCSTPSIEADIIEEAQAKHFHDFWLYNIRTVKWAVENYNNTHDHCYLKD